MAIAGFNSRILLGSLNLSCQVRQGSASATVELLDTSTLCDTGKAYLPGQDSTTFSADGPLDVDGSTDAPFDLLTSWVDASPITFGVGGLDAGDEAWLMDGMRNSFDGTTAATGLAEFSISSQTTGVLGIGKSLGLDTLTADDSGTAVDFGAAGTNGAVFQLHVTTMTGLTGADIIVEESSTGSSGWTTIATFATATGITSERIEISGAVKRYLRVSDDVTGTGTIIRGVAAALL